MSEAGVAGGGGVSFEHVSKQYAGTDREAVHDLNLEVADGEFLVLVGPSGCGKTTALRMVAGLEEVTAGTVRVAGRDVTDVPAQARDLAMVFQNYALYPHMTVAENIGFPLRLRKMPKEELRRRVEETAGILGLTELLGRKPAQLSGGQRQRVAMGRAIVRRPAAFLMDEPLSNLDAKLRVQMRSEIARIQRRLAVSTLYVTHDQTEAMTMGDRVAVMRRGELQQVAPPQELYARPVNLFVAAFIGSPSMNLYEADLAPSGDRLLLGEQSLPLPDELRRAGEVVARRGKPVVVGLRPEHLHEVAPGGAGHELLVDVELVEELGAEKLVHFRLDAHRVQIGEATVAVVEESTGPGLSTGEIGAAAMTDAIARFSPAGRARAGERIAVAVEVDWIYLFDEASGGALAPPPGSRAGALASN